MNTLILYVEDEADDVLFMRWALKKLGLADSLRSAGDGREAIEYLAGNGAYADRGQHPLPALMLLDLNLPVVSGFEVLRWMRNRTEFQGLPVVVFSSSTRDDDKVEARELGAIDYVEKPKSAAGFGKVAERLKEKWLSQLEDEGL